MTRTSWLALASLLASFTTSAAAPFQDALVQPPSIGLPQRGSLAGTLSRIAFGPGDLARGAFVLPLPLDAPGERGPLLAKIAPSYTPETGIGEWGVGWQADLAIRRYRPRGEVNFVDDDFTSPWGRLVAGDDGNYYPAGLASVIRVAPSGAGWIAETGDGTTYAFDLADAVTTPQGTFAWMLSRVDTITGDSTTLDWTRNDTGRPFLTAVHWGGRGDGTQYRMRLDYTTLTTPFVSYASGTKQLLDRRVSRVSVEVLAGGAYALRWRYDLAYQTSPSGPAFYLQQVTRTFASGQADPPITYDYDFNVERFASAQLIHAPGLDGYLATKGSAAIQPDHAAMTDLEQNGMTDLESNVDLQTARQTQTGFVIEPLPAASNTNSLCRPSTSQFNTPRVLARMHGDALEPHVLVARASGSQTRLLVCDRLGVPVHDENRAGNWQLGANIRLADIDQDQRPDFVRVGIGQVSVLRNTSSDPQSVSFEPGPTSTLTPAVTPIASWILDINGDGRADLVERTSSSVVVWLGQGNGAFEHTGTLYSFTLANGQALTPTSSYGFSFGDYNNDGLQDVLLTQGQNVLVFTNRGGSFVQTAVPGLLGIPWTVSLPVIADLSGSGNEVAMFANGSQAMAIQLTSASTGLLRAADDGKGTVLTFGYDRVAPAPGIIKRYSALASLTAASSGYDTVTYRYDYGAPIWHTIGKYLVGFATANKQSPVLREQLSFFNDDDVSGVPHLSEDFDDRTPGVIRFANHTYDDVRFHGVRWLRPASVESGFRSSDGATVSSTTTRHTTYERGFCPTVTTTRGPSGQLTVSTALASVAGIPDDLHCMPGAQTLFGSHADPSLDFTYLAHFKRNDLGQVTEITQFDPAMHPLVLQDVSYDADHRIASIGAPGRGTSTATYDEVGRLASITDPVGVVTQVSVTDPVSDDLLAIQTLRPGADLTAAFQFDGRERLQASWDDFLGGSAAQPLASYAYRDPTNTSPGRIDTQTLADALTGVSHRGISLVAADGEELVSGPWLSDHVALGTASIAFRATASRRRSVTGAMSGAALDALTSADLRALGTPIVDVVEAGFGHAAQTTTTQQAGVVGTVTTELALVGAELVTRVHQPAGFTAESALDAAGKVVRRTDENGIVHRYSYDVLGRVVRITTPDGAHALAFDGFGRPARVARDGIGAVTYSYDAATGLQVRRERLDSTGTAVHASQTRYDAIGRPLEVDQTAASGASSVVLDYDGQLGATTIPGQLGRTTRVRGDGWERSELFDPLGRAYQQHVTLAGWRDVTGDKTYRADGSVAMETLTIADPSGTVRLSMTKETALDGAGRVSAMKVDGATLYTLTYDDEARLARADFTSGEAIVFDYDPVTHDRRGYTVDAAASSGGVHWQREARGLVASETYDHGATTTTRTYGYDGRGSLTSSTTSADAATYSYSASGLPDAITDLTGTRSVRRTSSTITVGDTTYTWDAAGRVIGKGGWSLVYGANGQLVRATRAGRQIDLVYDDTNHRLLKRIDGAPARADLAGGVLTEDHFVEPVTVGGVVAGVLDNGVFVAMLTDPRGTPFVGPDGTLGLASPYGVRSSHLGYAEVIDYARLGWDPDLDTVRMGVREYDSKLSQFLTPDAFYLEDLDACSRSPIECNLYSYALNNPVSFSDPTGKWIWFVVMVGIALYEYEGTANAPTLDTPPERIIPSPTTTDLAKSSAKLLIAGGAGGRASMLFKNVIVRGTVAGVTTSVVSTALNDVDNGKFSGFKTYGQNALLGGLAGATLAGASRVLGKPTFEEPTIKKGPIPDQEPHNLAEQLALAEARATPANAPPAMRNMGDEPRLVANYGPGEWVKMHHVHKLPNNGGPVVVHWFRNLTTGRNVEFKFKERVGSSPGQPKPDPVSPTGNTRPAAPKEPPPPL